jgi:hypothetical protein
MTRPFRFAVNAAAPAVRAQHRVVVRQAHHTGAELDVSRALRCCRQQDLWRGDLLAAAPVVLADAHLFVGEVVEPRDQFLITLERQ